jgi:hypothetical protein
LIKAGQIKKDYVYHTTLERKAESLKVNTMDEPEIKTEIKAEVKTEPKEDITKHEKDIKKRGRKKNAL